MRIYDDGVYRDMTQEEIEEYNKQQSTFPLRPTIEERVASMEKELETLKQQIK